MGRIEVNGILLTFLLVLVLLLFMIPYYSMITMSTHKTAEIMRGDVLWFGKEALTNFNKVVSIRFFRVFLNSLYIAVLATLLSVFCSAMAAYSLSKFNYGMVRP